MPLATGLTEPLGSVVVPCFNQGCFVRKALASVFEQIWSSLEVIGVNDESSDDTSTVLGRVRDPRLRVLTWRS